LGINIAVTTILGCTACLTRCNVGNHHIINAAACLF